MIEYRAAQPQDMDEILDFINMVFSMAHAPHDFAKLLPKVYGPEARISHIHVIALEKGKICGCVGLLPFDLCMGGETLRCGYIGSVSAHPGVRGRGAMGEMMRRQIESAKAQGMDLMALGGQRQRYEHAGFALCGSRIEYTVDHANLRHALGNVDVSGISFRPMEPGGEDEAFAYALYQQGKVNGSRRVDRFQLALRSFNGTPYMILTSGMPVGYLIATPDHQKIYEIRVSKSNSARDVSEMMLLNIAIKAWMEQKDVKELEVVSAPHEEVLNQALAAYCEGYSIFSDEMFLCLNPAKVIAACMNLKNETYPLRDGELRLGFGDHGVLHIRVSGGRATVEKTQEPAEIALADRAAHEFVFGVNRLVWAKEERRAPAGWFPLHLQIPEADRF